MMVGRKVLLRVDKPPATVRRGGARRGQSRRRRRQRRRAGEGCQFNVRAGEIVGVAGVSRQRPDANCWRRWRACGAYQRRGQLNGKPIACRSGQRLAQAAPRGAAGPCARGPAARGAGRPLRPPRESAILGYHDDPAYATARSCWTSARSSRPLPDGDGGLRRAAAAIRCCAPRLSPAATSRRSCWRARSSAIPRCCWSASRPAASISAPSSSSTAAWWRCATPARRSCWCRSSSTRSSALADRILVMFDGRIVGELPRADATEAEARPADGRHRRGRRERWRAGPNEIPRWVDYLPGAAGQSGRGAAARRLVVLAIGANPLRALKSWSRRRRLSPRHRLSRSTTPPISSSPALPSPSPSMPACSTSAARARPISAASASALVCLAFDWPPWLSWCRSPWSRGGAVRRRLGLHPGLSAGQARQPHRHHHDHVQLHRLGADDLSAGRRADRAGPAGAAQPRFRAGRLAAVGAGLIAGWFGIDIAALAAQPLLPAGAALPACSSGCFIWHTRWGYELRTVGHSRARRALRRHLADPRHHHGDADLRRAGRLGRRQRDHGRASHCLLGLHRRRRLRRHRRGADGPQPSGRHRAWRRCCSARSIRAARSSPSTSRRSPARWWWSSRAW